MYFHRLQSKYQQSFLLLIGQLIQTEFSLFLKRIRPLPRSNFRLLFFGYSRANQCNLFFQHKHPFDIDLQRFFAKKY
jgi:hypothetical protein